jgi:hypothetical protein
LQINSFCLLLRLDQQYGVNESAVRKEKLIITKIELTGEGLFFRYAYPCTEIKAQRGTIWSHQVEALNALVDSDARPDHRLLLECFPSAVCLFGLFIGDDPIADDLWPVEMVREFWRMHKGRKPQCDVFHGVVESVNDIFVKVMVGDRKIPVFNRYKLQVSKGNIVFLHHNIIAESEKKEQ